MFALNAWADNQNIRQISERDNGSDCGFRIPVGIGKHELVGGAGDVAEQQGVTVRRGARCGLGADKPAGAGDVLDVELPTGFGTGELSDCARQNVRCAAGRERDDNAYASARKRGRILGPSVRRKRPKYQKRDEKLTQVSLASFSF